MEVIAVQIMKVLTQQSQAGGWRPYRLRRRNSCRLPARE